MCPYCNGPLMEIDHYGEMLVGCIHCNRWGHPVVAFLLLTLSLGLGGCFHHAQAVAAEPLPPPVSHPLK